MAARAFRISAWIILALLVLIVGLVGLALTSGVQTAVARRILRPATADLRGSLSFDRVHISPNGHILLRNVQIADDSGKTILAFDSLTARLRVPALRHDSIHVRELYLGTVHLNLSFDSSGTSNFECALSSREHRATDTTTNKSKWIVCADTVMIAGRDLQLSTPDVAAIDLPEWSLALRASYGNDSANYAVLLDAPNRLQLSTMGSLVLGYPLAALRGELSLHADSALLSCLPDPSASIGDFTLDAEYKSFQDSLQVDANVTASGLGNLSAVAAIPFPPGGIAGRGEVTLQCISPSRIAKLDEYAEINGKIRFSKTEEADIVNGWDVQAEFTDCRYGDFRLPLAELNISAFDSMASVRLFGDTEHGILRLKGNAVGFDPAKTNIDMTADFRRVNLHHFVGEIPDTLSPLSGRLYAQSHGLDPERIQARIELSLDTVRLGRHEVAELEARAEIHGDSLRLDTLICAIPGGTLGASADAKRGHNLAYAFHLEVPDLSVVRPTVSSWVELPESIAGSLAVSLEGTGSLAGDSLSRLTAHGNARLDEFRYDDITLSRARLRLTDGNLDSLSVRGALIVESLAAAQQEVDSIVLLFDGNPERASLNARLWARADSLHLSTAFDVSRSGNDLTVILNELRAEAYGLPCESEGVTSITLSKGHAEVDWLQLRSPIGVLRASGFVQQQGDQDMVIELSGLHTGELAQILKMPIPESTVNLRVQVTGPDTAMIGNLSITADSVIMEGTPLADEIELRATVDKTETTVDGFLIWFGDTLTIFSGELPIRFSAEEGFVLADSLPMAGDMQILEQPMSKLNPYLPFGMELGGTLTGDLTFSGTPAQPDWSGTFDVENGKYRDTRVGVDYRDLTINGRLDRDTLRLSHFDARSGGTLSGSGQAIMAFPLPRELQLNLAFENFEALHGPQMTVQASGNVSVSGPLNRLTARGSVQTDHVLYRITQATTKTIEEIDLEGELAKLRGDMAQPGFLLSEFYVPMSHELVVDVPGNCWLRGSGVNIELSGKLWLMKESGYDPSINGEITVREGRVQFLGKALRVTEGTVRYDGPVDNPTLDIRATSTQLAAQGTNIEVRIYGTLAKTQVELTGTDPDGQTMTPDQVMLALLMGRWRAGGSGVGLGPTSSAVEGAAANAATSQLSGLVGQWAGLDVFEYRPGKGGLSALSSGSLEVGTYVTDRLFIRVIQPVEQTQTGQEVSVEYRLLNWLKLRAQQNGTQSSAFDLFMQVDWR